MIRLSFALAITLFSIQVLAVPPLTQPAWREVPPTLKAWWKAAESPSYKSAAAHAPSLATRPLIPR